MTQGFLLIDGNNIGYAAQSMKPLRVGDQPTQAIYGSLRAIRLTISHYPQLTPIVLWDGQSWRKNVFDAYKANRDKEPVTKHEIAQAKGREEYKGQKRLIVRSLKLLGVRQMIADNLEADDLVGILVRRYAETKKIMMISGDKDWIQLVRKNVGWFDPMNDLRITAGTLSEKLGYMKKDKAGVETWRGVPSARAWLEIKCLQGDSSDNIPGVGGIGEKGAIELLLKYGSVASFMNQANTEKLDLPKKLLDFATDPEKAVAFQRNLALMDLCCPTRMPKPVNMRVIHQPLDRAAFQTFCGELAFVSFLKDLDGWLAPFMTVNPDLEKAA